MTADRQRARPPAHGQQERPPEGRGLAGEAAAATSDVDRRSSSARRSIAQLDGDRRARRRSLPDQGRRARSSPTRCTRLGFYRFEQLAQLTPTEIERLDEQLGAFRGRITRDRIVEQADYLARDDIDGFEQRFGKL